MTKTNRSRLLKLIALLLPLLIIFTISQEFLFDRRNYDSTILENFYQEEENSLDVVLMGASEVTYGYTPGYAYEKYGFTSYKYSLNANQGSLYLPQLKEILKTQNPEILIVDLGGFMMDNESAFFSIYVSHAYTRIMPFSENKVRTIMQLPDEEKLSYVFPLILYHNHPSTMAERLKEAYLLLTKEEQYAPLKGALTGAATYSGHGDEGVSFDPLTYKITDSSEVYLIEFLDYCKTNDLNVVFTNFPRYLAHENNHSLMFMFEQVKAIVEQYGYPVWNLQAEMDTIGIDVNQDFLDPIHLNITGQLKITDYISRRIMDECGLTPRIQSEQNRLEWETCVSNTHEFIELAMDVIRSGNRVLLYEAAPEWLYRNN